MTLTPHVQRLRPRTRRQYLVTGAAVLLVLVAAGWWFLGRADQAEAQASVATAATGTFQQTVSGSGALAPAKQADLDFAVSGRVTSVKVEAGDTVAKGDVLATLDTVSLDAALASAKAQREAAATTVANDGSDSSTQRAANEADLVSARADVTQAEQDLEAATLRATFTGTVASVTVAVGDQAGSSSSGGSAGSSAGGAAGGSAGASSGATTASTSTAAVTLVKPKKFVVDVDIAAADIAEVKPGLQVEITQADATETIFGTVKEVGRVAETGTTGAATFPVTVAVTGDQDGLYSGTTADVSIIVKQIEDVLTVPSQALTTTGGKTYVTKVDGSSTKKVAVTVGETYGMSTEITAGIAAGDEVQIVTRARVRSGGTSSGGGQQPGGDFGGGGMPPGGAAGGMGGFPGGGAPR